MFWLLLLVAATECVAQEVAQLGVMVKGVNINALNEVRYVELIGVDVGEESNKIVIEVDYGQRNIDESQIISGTDGKPYHFESMIHALNYMDKNGWEFVNAYDVHSRGQGVVYHFLLKRKS